MNKLRRYFITGLAVVVPVFLTVYVLIVAFRFTDNILGRFINAYFKGLFGFYVPGLGILIFLLAILLVGLLASLYIGKKILPWVEKHFANLPLIKNIYPTLKQIVSFILTQKEFGFKKVVLAEYPSKGIWSIGFLTNEEFKKISKVTGKEMASVFIPTSPGPLTGFVVFIAKDDLKFPDITVADALKIIISGGVFQP